MGKLFIIMGKTSSGKDTIYKYLIDHLTPNQGVRSVLRTVVSYTTRPMRPGETDGVEYFFVTEERLQEFRDTGKIIEERRYDTVHGPWYYFTVNDGQIDLAKDNYLMITTLAGYEKLRDYYSKEKVVPIYIEAAGKDRLIRYINREEQQKNPNYSEVCRRFLADEADFAEEQLARLGIEKRYLNKELEYCCQEIQKDIDKILNSCQDKLQTDSTLLERGQSHG